MPCINLLAHLILSTIVERALLCPSHRQGTRGSGWQNAAPRSCIPRDGVGIPRRVGGSKAWLVLAAQRGLLSLPPNLALPLASLRVALQAPCNWGRGQPLLPRSIFDPPPCLAECASDCLESQTAPLRALALQLSPPFRHLCTPAGRRRQIRESRAHQLLGCITSGQAPWHASSPLF